MVKSCELDARSQIPDCGMDPLILIVPLHFDLVKLINLIPFFRIIYLR